MEKGEVKVFVTAAEVKRGKLEVQRGKLEVETRSEMRKWEVEVGGQGNWNLDVEAGS